MKKLSMIIDSLANVKATNKSGEWILEKSYNELREILAELVELKAQEPLVWLVCSVDPRDGSLTVEYTAPWPEFAHAHINEAIELGNREAGSWVVRPVYVQPMLPKESQT